MSDPSTDGNPLFAGNLDSNPADSSAGAGGEVNGIVTGQVDAFCCWQRSEPIRSRRPNDVRMNTTAYGDNDPRHNNVPPYHVVKYYIRARGVTLLEDGTRITGGMLSISLAQLTIILVDLAVDEVSLTVILALIMTG